ncbi:beta-ketoacyl synthase N-terminal-like domain-containing protein [Desulfococcaceae bacterium HSG9]|nr:beta-ketoacyl synthase N-terminal-like domain-containing protein [Desulfococcaceae bacterium HSG9]
MKKKAPIAIVAMSGVFPGAPDLATFWHNIINKVNTVCESSLKRWGAPPETMYRPVPTPDMAISKRACLIRNFTFDPCGFDIAPDLLKDLDLLYHLVLHAGREAMAGRKGDESVKMRTGVTLAAMALPTDSASLLAREVLGRAFEARLLNQKPSETNARLSRTQCLSAKVTSLPGALLAQALGLGGGSLTLDAACASSLYAVKLACDELHAGRADAMLAGGVSRPDCLYTQVGFSQLKALSPSGRCAPFDVTADGLVVGEGVGLLVLKRLDDALRDQDKILGLIRGIGLSNDMQGNLLAPDSEGQQRALRYAYQAAGWSPSDVDLIECHGTGTPLGDVTELRSLRELWGADGWSEGQCAIGSVKSMIGHLLTGAGAAGLIKILLALQPPDDKTAQLPPSLHFDRAPKDSPLHGSPFKVQCETRPWNRRNDQTPRRAAINAFGFGGINAHLLIEEFMANGECGMGNAEFRMRNSKFRIPNSEFQQIAIVGMETVFGQLTSLKQFQEAVFNGRTAIGKRPPQRWRGSDALARFLMEDTELYGSFMEEVALAIGEFHIPPNEIPDILVQHLLMLKVCAQAMRDAGLPLRANRPDMGVIIGLEFDYEATDFHLRWDMPNHIETWLKQSDLQLSDTAKADWLEKLKDAIGPPLTHARTLNALPSIAASRIAREFRLGGPGFVVSCEAASGLRALEIGVRALQNGEMDTVLIGAVDLTGDVRNLIMTDKLNPFSRSDQIRPFDQAADGTLPGEGAVAMVLMPLDRALKDGHRIYATIKGIGAASGPIGNLESGIRNSTDAYQHAFKRAVRDADVSASAISYLETHGSGLELGVGNAECGIPHVAIGTVEPIIGHTGAAAGLASLAKTALCLYHQIIPPLPGYVTPADKAWANGAFFMPQAPQYWIRDRNQGPRHAAVNAFTSDGNYSSVILEGYEADQRADERNELKKPLGDMDAGLFVISGADQDELLSELDRFEQFLAERLSADLPLESVARNWYQRNRSQTDRQEVVTIVAADHQKLRQRVNNARRTVLSGVRALMSAGGVAYNPLPLGKKGEIAFVFPGSGNHYVGMGREIGAVWPEILKKIDAGTERLKSQMRPHCYVPWRTDWRPGWEKDAYSEIIADPLNTIFGQVVHGGVMAGLMNHFAIQPSAVIGYSLGESAGLFASGAWPERGVMLKRMLDTDLFTTQLAGPCLAARQAWNIPEHEAVDWRVALVNRSADTVGDAIRDLATARLLIINTPEQCVIGGMRRDIEAAIQKLKCEAVFLDGVVTVHCDAAQPVADAYRELHHFPVTPPPGIRYYSCAWGEPYKLTSANAADSIRDQATGGFDFPKLIQRAYHDGVRIFVEMGPHNSCTRMITKILGDQPFMAVSADMRGESDYLTVLKCLGALIAEGVPANMESLEKLYGDEIRPQATEISATSAKGKIITRILGGAAPEPMLPEIASNVTPKDVPSTPNVTRKAVPRTETSALQNDLIESQTASMNATAQAHRQFLKFSADAGRSYADAFALQNRLLAHQIQNGEYEIQNSEFPIPHSAPAFTREQCMEFAIGSVANVLGPDFAVVDTYDVRVRLPDEPLMLADRIISVQGEKRSLTSGCVITEHDVLPDAWYLDGCRAPVCIAVEAGQADLFLCSYLGIDHVVKGRRAYRLLDAKVKFHRGLPRPGEVIRYEIHIQKFVRQGDTYLFFFNFEGHIDGAPLITMTDGCAGFFTKEEVTRAGGLVLTAAETEPQPVDKNYKWLSPMPTEPESYDDTQIDALRRGDLASCFGSEFDGVKPAASIRLPGGRMKLIDRVLRLDARGGRFGLGQICAEADIHPDDWFLTCHFIDDMVMPGTLMYECCAHTLRVFLWRLGWVTDKPGVCYEPVCEVQSVLKCRGPVTPSTKKVLYQVDIREIGTQPEPYMIADALMFVDDLPMVAFKDMSMQMSGVTHDELENFWKKKLPAQTIRHDQAPLFDRHHILEFAQGKPSAAFGKLYEPFDTKFIARLPRPPYAFLDRIVAIEPQAWVLKPDGWIEAEYDIPPSEWYFAAERSSIMPYCVLLEIALQPCGWLAAYLGSALKIDRPLRFRNLGGKAVLHQLVTAESGTVTMRVRLTKVAEAGAMIIEHFDFKVLQGQNEIYTGNTYFGYFTQEALAEQAGIRGASEKAYSPNELLASDIQHRTLNSEGDTNGLAMPDKTLRMIDTIDVYQPQGGPHKLGFIRGIKQVDPEEWFFKAHFYQDPVCPGSLGIESFIQLLKYIARERWPHLIDNSRFEMLTLESHEWVYRGQIIQTNRKIEVEAVVTEVRETPVPTLLAEGYLKVDGLFIYQMDNFGLRVVPHENIN